MILSNLTVPEGWNKYVWPETFRPYLRPDAVTDTCQIEAGDHLAEFDVYTANRNTVACNSGLVAVVRTERVFRVQRAHRLGRLIQDGGPAFGPYVNCIEVDQAGNDVSVSDYGNGLEITRNKLRLREYGLALGKSAVERCFDQGLIKVSPHLYPGNTRSLQVPQGYINGDNSPRTLPTGFEHSVILDTHLGTFIPGIDEGIAGAELLMQLGFAPGPIAN